MRLYISSFRLGRNPKAMLPLINGNKRTALIMNSIDDAPADIRQEKTQQEIASLATLGLKAEELDLRHFFKKQADLRKVLKGYDYIWVRGGNVFILRRAFRQSGFDEILTELLAKDKIAYGGFSAGGCVLSPSLRGLEIVDPIDDVPKNYNKKVIWDGLSILDFAFVPHYKSDHPESGLVNTCVEYFSDNHMPFMALRDGEAIIVNGDSMKIEK